MDLNFSFIKLEKENVNEMKMMNEIPEYILLFFGFAEKLLNTSVHCALKKFKISAENIKNFVNSF